MSTSSTQAMKRNVRLMYFQRALLASPLFVAPTIMAFWTDSGLSVLEVARLQFVYSILICVLELPSGFIAVLLGRKRTLLAAIAFWLFGNLFYLNGQSFPSFVTAEVFVALGVSLISGTDQSVLFESLRRLGRESEFPKLWGRMRAIDLIAGAAAAIAGGHLAQEWNRLPFYAAMLGFGLLIPLVLGLREPPLTPSVELSPRPTAEPAKTRTTVGSMWRSFATLGPVGGLVLISALLLGFTPVFNVFSQKAIKDADLGVIVMGYMAAAGSLLAAVIAHLSHRLQSRLTEHSTIALIAIVLGAAFLGLSLVKGWWLVLFIALFRCNDAFSTIAMSSFINRRVPSEVRATVHSTCSLGGRLVTAGMMLLFGYLSTEIGLRVTFSIFAAIATGLILVFSLARRNWRVGVLQGSSSS